MTSNCITSHCRAASHGASRRGFSMTEMVICVSLMGVLATIAISSYSSATSAGKTALARQKVEMLNTAVHRYAEAVRELIVTPLAPVGSDELQVLRFALQFRHPDDDRATVGSPFIDATYNPSISASIDDYRMRWTGSLYELLEPGKPGVGLKVVFDGSDIGPAFVSDPNINPLGS
ncbi:MAG: prepilin-type N-terminal cleavage/methylation domain-containing protein [Verrucomicrobiales bacterium]|nr:prepilin-type N-terminal cleavage/methylation domain-containing protein [Verrucomicrobiales bacterium]